jgi:DNA (cytosine-5)-methyltransferase 1
MTGFNADNAVLIKQNTKQGYIKCDVPGVADFSYPDSKTRRGRVQENGQVVPTLTAMGIDGIRKIESQYRIRKLTPKECFRLMGFTDEEFEKAQKVNSNTQLYKQAGNSIVVNVLEEIFKELILSLEGKSPKYKENEQMSLFDFDI